MRSLQHWFVFAALGEMVYDSESKGEYISDADLAYKVGLSVGARRERDKDLSSGWDDGTLNARDGCRAAKARLVRREARRVAEAARTLPVADRGLWEALASRARLCRNEDGRFMLRRSFRAAYAG